MDILCYSLNWHYGHPIAHANRYNGRLTATEVFPPPSGPDYNIRAALKAIVPLKSDKFPASSGPFSGKISGLLFKLN